MAGETGLVGGQDARTGKRRPRGGDLNPLRSQFIRNTDSFTSTQGKEGDGGGGKSRRDRELHIIVVNLPTERRDWRGRVAFTKKVTKRPHSEALGGFRGALEGLRRSRFLQFMVPGHEGQKDSPDPAALSRRWSDKTPGSSGRRASRRRWWLLSLGFLRSCPGDCEPGEDGEDGGRWSLKFGRGGGIGVCGSLSEERLRFLRLVTVVMCFSLSFRHHFASHHSRPRLSQLRMD